MQSSHASNRIGTITVIYAALAIGCLAAPAARAGRVAPAAASEVGGGAAPVAMGRDVLPALVRAGHPAGEVPRTTFARPNHPAEWPPTFVMTAAELPDLTTDAAAAPVLAADTIAGEARRASLLPPDPGDDPTDGVPSLAAVGVGNVVAPLPPAALTGLPALAGLWAVRQWRRLRRGA